MTQINQTKYRKGVKLVKPLLVKGAEIPMINNDLRRLGYDDREIDLFWKSTSEFRAEMALFNGRQERLHAMQEQEDLAYDELQSNRYYYI